MKRQRFSVERMSQCEERRDEEFGAFTSGWLYGATFFLLAIFRRVYYTQYNDVVDVDDDGEG